MVDQGQAREWRSMKEARGSGLGAIGGSTCNILRVDVSCRALRKAMYVIGML